MMIRKAIFGSAVVFLLMFLVGATGVGANTFWQADPQLTGFAQEETPPATSAPAPSAPASSAPAGVDEAIRSAFKTAAEQNQNLILGFQIFDPYIDNIQYSQDGQTALLWMGLRDRETGLMIETEPGLSIASNPGAGDPTSPSSWSILLPAGQDYTDRLRALPPELRTDDVRFRFLEAPGALQPELNAVLSGYKLPWTAGAAKRVTNSIGHVYSVAGGLTSCPATCRYAFDFADGTMFPMLASKGGIVKSVKWTCSNGSTDCTNYLILEDQSTIPTSYQVYYHMAANSVPQRLRTVGAFVGQGEFIGDADDTGASTGHHLHFHVYHTPNSSNWTWGSSVDIIFDDVSQNGGRPRTCSEAREYPNMGSQCNTGNLYVSGNIPANPPQGTLELPANRQVLTGRTLRVQGSAADDLQITRIQVVANYDGTWKAIDDIAPNGNGPFMKDIDLCAAKVPEGPVAVTVRIYDREGSLASNIPVRQIIKNANCGTTADLPAPRSAIIVYPFSNLAPTNAFTIEASAVDFDGGQVAAVDFYWHGPDWNAGWVKLGTDSTPSDGWTFDANPAAYGSVQGAAVYIQAVSHTGGVRGSVVWDLTQDLSLPTSQLLGLPAQVNSTAVQLNWTASDAQNDIARFDVEFQRNSGSGFSGWQAWTGQTIQGYQRSAWFVGAPGSSYRFRIRAVDRGNHIEAYPDTFEAATSLAANCQPDPNEKGQTADNPLPLTFGQISPLLNICRSAQAGTDDVDWLTFDAQAGQKLLLMVAPRSGGPKLAVSLYSDTSEYLGTYQSSDYGIGVNIQFTAPRRATYYVEVKPAHAGLFGSEMSYQAWFGTGTLLYLPEIYR